MAADCRSISAYVRRRAQQNPVTSPYRLVGQAHHGTRATMLNRLTASLDFHGQALTLRSERQRLLASNIANADTPGYVARDMDFAAALRQATGSSGTAAALNTSTAGPSGRRSIRCRMRTWVCWLYSAKVTAQPS